jgi:hypothetical protein
MYKNWIEGAAKCEGGLSVRYFFKSEFDIKKRTEPACISKQNISNMLSKQKQKKICRLVKKKKKRSDYNWKVSNGIFESEEKNEEI